MITNTEKPAVRILLVEDNPGDVDLMRAALRRGNVPTQMMVARNGVEALEVLHQMVIDGDLPDIIFLDLNIPRKNGREVLQEIKADPRLRRIPVLVITSSGAALDISQSYKLNASCYIIKPVDLDQFLSIVKLIEMFWFKTVTLPGNTANSE